MEDVNKMHLGDGTDSADKVNGDEALEINVVVERGLEDGYANSKIR